MKKKKKSKAVKWYDSGYWDAEELKKELDKYKIEKEKREWDVIVKIIKKQSMKAKRTLRSYESCSSSV